MDDINHKDFADLLKEELTNTTKKGLIKFCLGQQQQIILLTQLLQCKPEGKILLQKHHENGDVEFDVGDYIEN